MKTRILVAALVFSNVSIAKEVGKSDLDVMRESISLCQKMPNKEDIASNPFARWEYDETSDRYFRTLKKLKPSHNDQLYFDYVVDGDKFGDIISACTDKISSIKFDLIKSGEAPPDDELSSMKDIVRYCKQIPTFDFPISDLRAVSSKINDFNDRERWIKRSLDELIELEPKSVNYKYSIDGAPFDETLGSCLDEVQRINFGINDIRSKSPNMSAIKLWDEAYENCQLGIKILGSEKNQEKIKYFDKDVFQILDKSYLNYNSKLNSSINQDSKIRNWKNDEIEHCNSEFVVNFLAIKEVYDEKDRKEKEEKRKRQERLAAEAEERAIRIGQQIQDQENRKKQKAKSLGYDNIMYGVINTTLALGKGAIEQSHVKSSLIETSDSDNFKFSNFIGDYAVYTIINEDDFSLTQILVKRREGKFYNEGAKLEKGFYIFTEVLEVQTILGVRKQVLAFERVALK